MQYVRPKNILDPNPPWGNEFLESVKVAIFTIIIALLLPTSAKAESYIVLSDSSGSVVTTGHVYENPILMGSSGSFIS